ncbi:MULTISPECIES: Com family DNA-binding transcriptional regulator [unclassified Sphingobium]|uniref:Com family DNA-binding transcriptional regulator n=1 Tax=unclassified Sphingobium TaxID=2611147 RepID=UPI00191A84F8
MRSSTHSVPVSICCASCSALLFKAEPAAIAGIIEIKCRRCGTFNCLRPASPNPTADRAAEEGKHDVPRQSFSCFSGSRLPGRQAQPGAPDLRHHRSDRA